MISPMTTPAKTRRRLEQRVYFLSALAQAGDHRAAVLGIVERSADRAAAVTGLRAQFGWEDLQARAVLSQQLEAWAQDRRADVATDLADARAALADLG